MGLRTSGTSQMKNFSFAGKNLLRPWPIYWIERALYAKTSHPHICYPRGRGNLPESRNGAAILGADSKV
jgi:hypothetical protein